MSDLIKYFITLIDDLPVWLQISLILLIIVIIFTVKSNNFRIYFILMLKKYFISINKRGLLTDDIFVHYKKYLRDVQNFSFGDKFKDDLFKTLLTIKIHIIIDKLKLFLKKEEHKNISKYELYTNSLDLVNDIILTYEMEYKKKLVEQYGEGRINELYDYTSVSFRKYHQKNIDMLIDQLLPISESEFLKNNYQRLSYLTFQCHIAMRNGIMDCEKTFKNFNGTLNSIYAKLNSNETKV